MNFKIFIKLLEKKKGDIFQLKMAEENICLNGSLDFQKNMYINENILYTNPHKNCSYTKKGNKIFLNT